MKTDKQPELLRADEVGKWLGLSTIYVLKLVREGRLPHIRFGRAVYFSRSVLEQWLEEASSYGEKRDD